jgi:hypothetical protein
LNLGVVFRPSGPINEGACQIAAPVEVTGLAEGIALTPSAKLACATAEALARWVGEVVVPASIRLDAAKPTGIAIASSYACRGRNNDAAAPLSEHALGNAVDIAAIAFAGRTSIALAPSEGKAEADFRAAIRRGACSYFTTVLGPGADEAHKDHLHLDLRSRESGYRICE